MGLQGQENQGRMFIIIKDSKKEIATAGDLSKENKPSSQDSLKETIKISTTLSMCRILPLRNASAIMMHWLKKIKN